MEQDKGCEICKKMMREKHKHDKLYKIGFYVLLVLFLICFALLVGTGTLVDLTHNDVETNIEASVDIDNNGNENNNNVNVGNGSHTFS